MFLSVPAGESSSGFIICFFSSEFKSGNNKGVIVGRAVYAFLKERERVVMFIANKQQPGVKNVLL